MSDIVNFGIELPIKCFEHIKEMSYYDNNYYKIKPYGDWFGGTLDILKQKYFECENCYTYSLGKIVDGKYVEFIDWTTGENIFE